MQHPTLVTERSRIEELKWKQMFEDTSKWWDNRQTKWNPKYPDFKHSTTGESLYLDSSTCPSWVLPKLKPLQSSDFFRRARFGTENVNGLDLYESMRAEGIRPSIGSILAALKASGDSKDLKNGQRIHAELIQTGDAWNVFVANTLVDMYAKCREMEEAYAVFQSMPQRTVASWNYIILGYAVSGESHVALELYSRMQTEQCWPNTLTFVAALRACTSWAEKEPAQVMDGKLLKVRALEFGKAIHLQAVANGRELSDSLLLNFYCKCGSMVDARHVFNSSNVHSVVSWSIMIRGYAHNDEAEEALELFECMQEQGCIPNHVTVLAVLKALGNLAEKEEIQVIDGEVLKVESLRKCRLIHKNCRDKVEISVASALIDVYVKCGSIVEARQVFDSIHRPDIVAWNCIIMGHAISGHENVAFKTFSRMKATGCAPNAVTYVAVLKACGGLAEKEIIRNTIKSDSLTKTKEIHIEALESEKELDIYLASTLVETYAKCGSIVDARDVFESSRSKDALLWGVIILSYYLVNDFQTSLEVFERMQDEGCTPNAMGVSAALKACSGLAVQDGADRLKLLVQGRNIDRLAEKNGLRSNILVLNALIDMYSKCGSLVDAIVVFEGIQQKTVSSWNCVIAGYLHNGDSLRAFVVYQDMQKRGCVPDGASFVSALKACANLGEAEEVAEKWLEMGRGIHSQAEKAMDIFVESILVDMYAKCGSILEARRVFDGMKLRNVVSWTAIIQGYARCGQEEVALELYQRMQDEGCTPDHVAIVAALKTCASLADRGKASEKALETGRSIHKALNVVDTKKLGYVLVDMYVKCGSVVGARGVFEAIEPRNRDVVVWTSLLQGYMQSGENELALELYRRMHAEGVVPDSLTYVIVLKACGNMASLEYGKKVHLEVIQAGLEAEAEILQNTLVDFYGKCGNMVEAEAVFERMKNRDVFTWGALIAGYSRQGNAVRVLELFHRMQDEDRVQANEVIYLSVLTACSHAGNVEEGIKYFERMSSCGWVKPGIEHYNCMIDILARANRLEEAVELARSMPVAADEVTWTSLLSGCLKWKNVEFGRLAHERLLELGAKEAAGFVLMPNLC